jgi:hypothetical protein
LKVIKSCLGRVITAFGVKETPKFREITAKLTDLETELKKNEVNQNRVSSLKNEIIPKFTTKNEGDYDNLNDFYFSPIVYTYFNKNLVEKIEQTRSNRELNEPSQDKYDYQTSDRGENLQRGDHPIIRRYEELATKIFKDKEAL